ncbi:3-dehydroquinate synthase [Candidatus Nitrospira bockiana]
MTAALRNPDRPERASRTPPDGAVPAGSMPDPAWLQHLTVPFEYPVYFTSGVFEPDNPAFLAALSRKEPARRHRVAVVIDAGVLSAWPALPGDLARYAAVHADHLALAGDPIAVPGGEAIKNDPRWFDQLTAAFDGLGLDRQSFVTIIGGGAVLDLVGYAAAVMHRGLRIVRMPTTVLAQNDAGLSVKNGRNAFGKKNCLGAFAPPFAVLNDDRFLHTLEPRDRRAGMAEAVKVALIRDAGFFRWLVDHRAALRAGEHGAVRDLVAQAARLHLDHIGTSGDPFETGSARPLDFGHWAAHKLETLSGYSLRHGEAVAIGIALDTLYSVDIGRLDSRVGEQVLGLFHDLGFSLWSDALAVIGKDGRPALLDGLGEFREHLGGELSITLLSGIGQAFEAPAIDERVMTEAIRRLELTSVP